MSGRCVGPDRLFRARFSSPLDVGAILAQDDVEAGGREEARTSEPAVAFCSKVPVVANSYSVLQ